MATDLIPTNAAAPAITDPAKWLTPIETSALADRGTILPFNPRAAANVIPVDRACELALRLDGSLMPIEHGKLAARLRVLWESTTAPQNLTAKAWLHETGRLLADLPQDIVYAAIDRAVLASDRGFTPSVAAIRAIADPMLADRRRLAARMQAVRAAHDAPAAAKPADLPHAGHPLARESTADILSNAWPTMADHEGAGRRTSAALDPERPCRAPTREDYLRLGVDPAVLDRMDVGKAARADVTAEAA